MDLPDILRATGIDLTVSDDELLESAVVIAKVIEPDGDTRLAVAWSDGLGWIERAGMLAVADRAEHAPDRSDD